ncbi:hypothetical protein [Methylobacterium sp. P1-11]|uniref:hypothetical protein n=1 Tax=Methylobacterium sp. P1-11 TaxID=2024616 RepID=UPI0011EDEA84|nr:hypothetical protein [Methylobacterium sp. P1-11]
MGTQFLSSLLRSGRGVLEARIAAGCHVERPRGPLPRVAVADAAGRVIVDTYNGLFGWNLGIIATPRAKAVLVFIKVYVSY